MERGTAKKAGISGNIFNVTKTMDFSCFVLLGLLRVSPSRMEHFFFDDQHKNLQNR